VTAAGETLRLGPREAVTVRVDSPEVLEVEATYGPASGAPPKHFHPAQDEHFEVLAGTLTARLGDEERKLAVGATLDIPRGVVHQMWNEGPGQARVAWRTTPAGRTLEWFRAIDELQGGNPTGKPSLLAFAPLLNEYRDVFRVPGPDPVLRPLFEVIAGVSRLRRS
jgi:quercetin dioxygenase-like cupin family protein